MEKLIPVINKLQEVFNATGTGVIELPQIVAVGEQSSGKSSVLENLVGRSCLPRGTGIVTRCPIVLQMIQMSEQDENYKRQKVSHGAEEWAEFPHLPEGQRIVTDFNKITNVINKEVDSRAGTNKGIVKEELIMKIYSPNVINLTVVDLPGIVRNPTGDQPEDIEKQINELIKSYIKNPNSIILAVSMANNDIALSESLKMAKSVDPNCDRTVAVVTKLDLMDHGTDASEVLTGKLVKIKLGIVGVVNRSFKDIESNKSISASLDDEAEFLKTNYPRIASQNGTPFLKNRLQKILMEHIRSCLPALMSRITNMKIQAEEDLKALGGNEPVNKSSAMLNIIEKFCTAYRAAILGKTRDIEKRQETGGARLKAIFEIDLADDLKVIDPAIDLQNSEILNTIKNSSALESSVLFPEAAYQDLVRVQIRRLTDPAMHCATLVNTQMLNIMHIVMTILESEMGRFPGLTTAISCEVAEILEKRHLVAQEILKTYVEVHASFIKTIQETFNKENQELLRQSVVSKENGMGSSSRPPSVSGHTLNSDNNAEDDENLTSQEKDQCFVVRQLVNNYFLIVKSAFQDYCPKAIAYSVIYYMEKKIHNIIMEKLHTADKIEVLVKENSIIAEQRERIVELLQALESASEAIGEIRDANF